MPEKTTPAGRTYNVTGRSFSWDADVDVEGGEEPFTITIPLRLKLKVLRGVGGDSGNDMNMDQMFGILDALAPGQPIEEMDANDFGQMFTAWQFEYELLNGASLGEALSSPS